MKLPPALIQALGLQPTPDAVETLHYRAFVQEAALNQQVWGLLDAGGWISLPLAAGASCLPVWAQPHEAQAYARGARAGWTAGAIDLADLLDHWLPAMDSLGVQVAVQPVAEQPLVPVPARVLAWHLQVRCIQFPAFDGEEGNVASVTQRREA